MNLILCGFPGCGKSYFGKLIAKELGWEFVDTDSSIEALNAPLSSRDITIQRGESYFRKMEEHVVGNLDSIKHHVVATGGGTLMRELNRKRLKALGTLLYFKLDKEILWQRLMKKNEMPSYINPLEPKTSFEHLFQLRTKIYEECCDQVLEIDHLTDHEVVKLVSKHAQ